MAAVLSAVWPSGVSSRCCSVDALALARHDSEDVEAEVFVGAGALGVAVFRLQEVGAALHGPIAAAPVAVEQHGEGRDAGLLVAALHGDAERGGRRLGDPLPLLRRGGKGGATRDVDGGRRSGGGSAAPEVPQLHARVRVEGGGLGRVDAAQLEVAFDDHGDAHLQPESVAANEGDGVDEERGPGVGVRGADARERAEGDVA